MMASANEWQYRCCHRHWRRSDLKNVLTDVFDADRTYYENSDSNMCIGRSCKIMKSGEIQAND